MKEQFILFAFALFLFVIATGGRNQTLSWAFTGMPDGFKPKGYQGQLFQKVSKLFFQTKEEGEAFANGVLEKVKSEVGKLNGEIDTRLKQVEESVKNGGTVDPALKNELTKLSEKHDKLTQDIDSRLAEFQKLKSGGDDNGKPKTLIKHLNEVFNEKGEGNVSIVDRIKSGRKEPIEVSLKAVGDISASNLTGSYFAGYDLRPGVIGPPQEAHLRPMFRQTTTSRDTIRYAREVTKEGGFDMVAAGGTKPQIDWDLSMEDSLVRKIAGYFRLPEEMIDDIPYLLSYLTTRGVQELQNMEDYQFISGNGSGQNLKGLIIQSTAFDAGLLRVASPKHYDVLVAAKKQLRKMNLIPSYFAVSPEDYAAMRLTKKTDGGYIFPAQPGTDIITVDGTPIFQNNNIPDGYFFGMDTNYIEVADRMAPQVRLYDQDRDNAIKNMVTCVIEERLAFTVYRPQAVIYGSFTDAISALTPNA